MYNFWLISIILYDFTVQMAVLLYCLILELLVEDDVLADLNLEKLRFGQRHFTKSSIISACAIFFFAT